MRPLLVARIALTILMMPSAAAAQGSPPPPAGAKLDFETARAVESLLASVFRSQAASGAYGLTGPSEVLAARPLFATMALDAFRTTNDTAALSQAVNSISRHYGFLFSSADRDGDRLVESSARWQGRDAPMEDPAFNALLAIDLKNLARAHLELRRTMQALYWYDGARSVERALVAGLFDPEANYCFARDPANGQPLRDLSPVAGLAGRFTLAVGANHAAAMRAHVVSWAAEHAADRTPSAAEAAIDRMSAIDLLRGAGHDGVVAALRAVAPSAATPAPVERYAAARGRMDRALADEEVVLGLLAHIVRTAGTFSDSEKFRIDRAVPQVRALVFPGTGAAPAGESADAAIQATYAAASGLRERLRSSAFFSPDDKRAYPGVDANVATQRLLEDVAALLRRAENRVFETKFAATGAAVNATLVSDEAVVTESIDVRWEVTTREAPVSFVSVSAGIFGEAISPVRGRVAMATAPLRFTTRHPVRGGAGALRLLTLTAVFETAPGKTVRYHLDRSLYVHAPVAVVARFPKGRTVRGNTVPIELAIRRHADASVGAKYFWFSPSGLRLREGNTGVVRFGAADSMVAKLHVEIPAPCRPGVFPFTLKVLSNERDAGTIASSLFKPYQWTYAGPFSPEGGIARAQAPEQGVNLLQDYPGPNGSVRWRPVPESACGPHGEISLGDLAADRGAHYLYTVVACAYETDIVARLSASGPAALFVNGRRVAEVKAARGDSASAVVHLDPDKNNILIKIMGDRDAQVSFALGNDDNLAADEFSNDLAELAGGYRELTARELASGSAPSESRRLVTLRFQDPDAGAVAVVGSFNGWSPQTHRMQKNDGVWELTLSLAPGRYAYRFLVDEKKQVLDPSSAATEPDGYGGKNSVLIVTR